MSSCFGHKRHRSEGSESDNRESKRRREDRSERVERAGSDTTGPNSSTATTSGASLSKTAVIWDIRSIPFDNNIETFVSKIRNFVKKELLFGKAVNEFHVVFNVQKFGSNIIQSLEFNTITIHDINDDIKKSIKDHIMDLINTFDKNFKKIVLLGESNDLSEVLIKARQKGIILYLIHQNKGMKCLKEFVSKNNCFLLKEVIEGTKESDPLNNGHIFVEEKNPSLKGVKFHQQFSAYLTRMQNRGDKPLYNTSIE